MSESSKTRSITIHLSENHPIFYFDESMRDHIIQEIFRKYSKPQTIEKELAQLAAKVDSLNVKLELVSDVLETVLAIKEMLHTQNDPLQKIAPTTEDYVSAESKEEPPIIAGKSLKFDVDAFLDLG